MLILAARDWQHPQGGGSGENVRSHLEHWVRWGASVSVISGGFPAGASTERGPGYVVHRMGSDSTVFPHAIARHRQVGVFPVDMALEYVSGIFFLTPLWLRRTARVVWFHHVHRAQYSVQYGAVGRVAGAMLETLPPVSYTHLTLPTNREV